MTTSEGIAVTVRRIRSDVASTRGELELGKGPRLELIAYGSLRPGGKNHDRFCTGLIRSAPATIFGRLAWFTPEIPIAAVPAASILALGSQAYLHDVASGQEIPPERIAWAIRAVEKSRQHWPLVEGDLLSFDDPATRLAALDRLEGFAPSGESLYLRVLVPIVDLPGRSAWVYVSPDSIARRRP